MESFLSLQQHTRQSGGFYRSLPKIDLHRHLEGSVRFSTLKELARGNGMKSYSTHELQSMVQIQKGETYTSQNFLSKFATLRLFYRSPEIIKRITREAVADAGSDHVRYLELRFSPAALSKAQGFPLELVIDWVVESAKKAEREFGVITRLITSVNRHESPALAAQIACLAAERRREGIIGLDLAGDEARFSARPFQKVFDRARQAGLHITVHAGEWSSSGSVTQAIEQLGAERVGHGIRVLESPEAIELALERHTVFEVCLTSNYQSGAIPKLEQHPLPRMLSKGLNATINSDDPGVSQIDLSTEYRLACEGLGLSLVELRGRVLAAARATFLPEAERQRLVDSIEIEFPKG